MSFLPTVSKTVQHHFALHRCTGRHVIGRVDVHCRKAKHPFIVDMLHTLICAGDLMSTQDWTFTLDLFSVERYLTIYVPSPPTHVPSFIPLVENHLKTPAIPPHWIYNCMKPQNDRVKNCVDPVHPPAAGPPPPGTGGPKSKNKEEERKIKEWVDKLPGADLSVFLPLRGDFDHEHDNGAEEVRLGVLRVD